MFQWGTDSSHGWLIQEHKALLSQNKTFYRSIPSPELPVAPTKNSRAAVCPLSFSSAQSGLPHFHTDMTLKNARQKIFQEHCLFSPSHCLFSGNPIQDNEQTCVGSQLYTLPPINNLQCIVVHNRISASLRWPTIKHLNLFDPAITFVCPQKIF